jgi:GGDEF domain-containing protein
MMVLIIEPNHLCGQQGQFGEQGRDLALIGAADQLRSLARPTDIVARIGDTRFGMVIFETGIESLEETWARMHSAVAQQLQIGAAIFASDRPASLEALLDQAAADLNPTALTTEA